VTVDGASGIIAEIAAEHGQFDGVGCGAPEVRSNYHSLTAIFILAHMGILVFCFRYK
jgi:hypothetical protein